MIGSAEVQIGVTGISVGGRQLTSTGGVKI